MGEVWESSSAKGGARLVLLALADFANDDGHCYPSLERLALKSALTERNVQLILRQLEARGELVTLIGAGRGHVNAYWVLPPATVARLTLEGKTAKNFHPLARREEKVKGATERVKPDAQTVKSTAEKVKPVAPRTVKNHQEPLGTTNPGEAEVQDGQSAPNDFSTPTAPTRAVVKQHSSADRTTPGTAEGSARNSGGAASVAWTVWLETNAVPEWLELDAWTRWLRDLDERKTRFTSARLELQLQRLRALSGAGESQANLIARAIGGGWETFYPERAQQRDAAKPVTPHHANDRYGRYR
jgi:Helix-turn-helix domain